MADIEHITALAAGSLIFSLSLQVSVEMVFIVKEYLYATLVLMLSSHSHIYKFRMKY